MQMQPGLSTHVFLQQRLHPGLLDALHHGGAQTIELFTARHHFDYSDRAAVRDVATWFRNTGVAANCRIPRANSSTVERNPGTSIDPSLIDEHDVYRHTGPARAVRRREHAPRRLNFFPHGRGSLRPSM